MTNPTQPTPEQLVEWTEEFLIKQPAIYTRDNPRFIHDAELRGYLRRCQETELTWEPFCHVDMQNWPPIRWGGKLRCDIAPFDGQPLYIML